jgi:Skp family chaperone for outer membrane proteins
MNKRVFVWAAGALLSCGVMMYAQATAQPPATTKPAAPAQTTPPAATQATPPARAASTALGANKVATVNIQAAIGLCGEGKKASDDLAKRFAPKKDELERKQKDISDLQQKLQQGEKILTDEQRTTLMRDIDRKTKDFNRDNDDATADYQQAVESVMNGIGGKMMQVVAVYAQQNGFDLVLNSAQAGQVVLWQKETADITQEIVGAYNMTFPSSGALAPPPPAPGSGKPPATTPRRPQP